MEEVKELVKRILLERGFFPDIETYMNAAHAVYKLSTAQIDFEVDPKYSHLAPFEKVHAVMQEYLEKCFSEHQMITVDDLKTFLHRARVLDHIFIHVLQRRHAFIYFFESPTYSELVSVLLAKMINNAKESSAALTKNSVSLFTKALKGDPDGSIEPVRCLLAIFAEARKSGVVEENYARTDFNAEVKAQITSLETMSIKELQSFTKNLADVTAENFEPEGSYIVRSIVYETLVAPRESDINSALIPVLKDENGPNQWEFGLLTTLSFFATPETPQKLWALCNEFISKFTADQDKQEVLKEVAKSVMTLLRATDDFFRFIIDPDNDLRRYFETELKFTLGKVPFARCFGGDFAAMIAFIVDGSLKRGNVLKGIISGIEDIRKLLRLVNDRDIFIFQHTCNMFNRLATRSTTGVDKEMKFLEMVGTVTGEEPVKSPIEICEQATERNEPSAPNFSYVLFRQTLIPGKAWHRANMVVPDQYLQLRSNVDGILKQRYPGQQFLWLDRLATVEVKMKQGLNLMNVTLSLSQFRLFEALSKRENSSWSDLSSDFTADELKRMLMRFVTGGLVVLTSGSVKNIESAQFKLTVQSRRLLIIADNWDLAKVRTRKVAIVRADRSDAIKACIVRVMKMKRMIKANELREAVMKELSNLFPVDKDEFTKLVRSLIANEYIQQKDQDYLIYLE